MLLFFYFLFFSNNNIINIIPNENNPKCTELDPINILNQRLKNGLMVICKNKSSNHICYKNKNSMLRIKNGVFCKMNNFVLDPSKWKNSGFIYKGPVDLVNKGCPLISKGFFNMNCKNNKVNEVNYLYNTYFESWNYEYFDNMEIEEELAPGKTIFFLSRNQDSPNLFHGGSELINAISMMHLLKLVPEQIQIIFLESISINNDPFYDLYKNLISREAEPIYIKNLKKKYYIKSAIHLPINWDSPCYHNTEVPNCKYPTNTYILLNKLIDKYLTIENYVDTFITDNSTYYYPKTTIANHISGNDFKNAITIIWRRVWPKGRKGQTRILGNGPELAEKLALLLPKNILIRLVDTASLNINKQISIMKKTDYLVGIHVAGFALSIFTPNTCIIHEILPKNNLVMIMESLSGHKIYSDETKVIKKNIDNNEYLFIDVNDFVKNVINHMKENNFYE